METISYSDARGNFRKTLEMVCDNHEPVIITRQNERPVVMMSLDDYNAMEETMYLMRSPKNAARLLEAMADISKGENYQQQDLIEE
jgi:antitoxin YefM